MKKRRSIVALILVLGITLTGLIGLAGERVETNVPISEKYVFCRRGNKLIKVPTILIEEKGEHLFKATSEQFVWDKKNKEIYSFLGKCKVTNK